jgi:hypothetical protein
MTYPATTACQRPHRTVTPRFTYEYIPRTNIYRRGSDCPEGDQVTIRIEDGALLIEGAGLDLTFSGLPPRDPKETAQ